MALLTDLLLSHTGSRVLVRVPDAQRPWQCDVQGGRVTNVVFLGAG